MTRHELLKSIIISLLDDYTDYGGKIKRWEEPDKAYPDCSGGCRFFKPLHVYKGEYKDEEYTGPDLDFGVCSNPDSRRGGLLTFEHQAGSVCFTPKEEKEIEE